MFLLRCWAATLPLLSVVVGQPQNQIISVLRQKEITSGAAAPFASDPTSTVDLSSLLASLQSAISQTTVSSSAALITPSTSAGKTSASFFEASAAPALVPSVVSPTSSSSSSLSTATAVASTFSDTNTGGLESRKTLVIVLAVVFSVVGLSLLIIGFFLIRRYRRGQAPFSKITNRGVTPIDDDEIATWRNHSEDMGEAPPGHHRKTSSSIIYTPQPIQEWKFDDSPVSSSSGRTEPTDPALPPSILAQAPNARTGLTDQAVPGAAAFVPPPKRQSSRLSKSKLPHVRTKSRHSSFSGSTHERPMNAGAWFDGDDDNTQRHFHRTDSWGSRKMSLQGSRSQYATTTPPTPTIPSTPRIPSAVRPTSPGIGRALL